MALTEWTATKCRFTVRCANRTASIAHAVTRRVRIGNISALQGTLIESYAVSGIDRERMIVSKYFFSNGKSLLQMGRCRIELLQLGVEPRSMG